MSRIHVIAYDIRDTCRRTRVARVLEGYGRRVQKSVFECELSHGQLADLRAALTGLCDSAEDQVRFYPLCGKDREMALHWDTGGRPGVQGLWVL